MNRMNGMNKLVLLFNIQIRIDLDKDEEFIIILLSNEIIYNETNLESKVNSSVPMKRILLKSGCKVLIM